MRKINDTRWERIGNTAGNYGMGALIALLLVEFGAPLVAAILAIVLLFVSTVTSGKRMLRVRRERTETTPEATS